jgi:hypothetical protein
MTIVVAGADVVVDAPCESVQIISMRYSKLKNILLLLLLAWLNPTPSPIATPTTIIARAVIAKESQKVTLRNPHIISWGSAGAKIGAFSSEWLKLAGCCSHGCLV